MEDIKRKIEWFKVLFIASAIIFSFAIISLFISLISTKFEVFGLKEILYVIVISISFLLIILFLLLFIKTKKELNKENNGN